MVVSSIVNSLCSSLPVQPRKGREAKSANSAAAFAFAPSSVAGNQTGRIQVKYYTFQLDNIKGAVVVDAREEARKQTFDRRALSELLDCEITASKGDRSVTFTAHRCKPCAFAIHSSFVLLQMSLGGALFLLQLAVLARLEGESQ